MKEIGQELDFLEVSKVLQYKRTFQEGDGYNLFYEPAGFQTSDNKWTALLDYENSCQKIVCSCCNRHHQKSA
jgi:hypothetical protein